MEIICFSGQKLQGKDLAADYLAAVLGWERSAFAAAVKEIYCETFGVDLEFVEKWKSREEIPPGFEMTVRESLQFIGDGFRRIQGSIWVNLAFRNIYRQTIFSDGRYINELKRVHTEGGINVLLYRPGHINDDPNGSEAQIKPLVEWFVEHGWEGVFDESHFTGNVPEPVKLVDIFLRNDGTPEELYVKLDNIVIPYMMQKSGLMEGK
jgi:hypothetical protein